MESIGGVGDSGTSNYWNMQKDFSDPFVYDFTNEKIENLDLILDTLKDKPEIEVAPYDRTFYTVGENTITRVDKKYFNSLQLYYWAMVHEHIHWTGDAERLSRPLFFIPSFLMDAKDMAFEEVVAEIGTRLIFELTGNITDDLRTLNSNYISNMAVHIGGKSELLKIAKHAIIAVEYMLENSDGWNSPQELLYESNEQQNG